MFEINVTVRCPDLVTVAALLAKQTTLISTPNSALGNPPQTVLAGSEAPTTAAPTAAPVAVTAPAASAAPLAQAPQFTLEQISRAGAELITKNPSALPQVNAALSKFGVQTLDKLKPDQMGAFATMLRDLGAKI